MVFTRRRAILRTTAHGGYGLKNTSFPSPIIRKIAKLTVVISSALMEAWNLVMRSPGYAKKVH
ncbi:hypothetical protein F383_37188 [Gossypium arboreum]|uniref:Uncharacterized protein n=1 Tax=Gossypium arboreum TaxID=29729 RepID=A0A0B0MFL4_GOSAR|nr:hypothetical protein F383_37188 [Gossypium arboreum]